MIANWWKIYWQTVRKNWINYTIGTISLGVALSFFFLAFIYFVEENSYDSTIEDVEKIFVVERIILEDMSWMKAPYGLGLNLKEKVSGIDDYLYVDDYYGKGNLEVDGVKKAYKKLVKSQKNYFDFFSVNFLQGDPKDIFQQQNNIAIRQDYAENLFGNSNPMGKELIIEENLYIISAVFENSADKTSFNPELVISSLDAIEKEEFENWGSYYSSLWIKIKDKQEYKEIQKQLNSIAKERIMFAFSKENAWTPEEAEKELGLDGEVFKIHPLENQRMIAQTKLNATPEGAAIAKRVYTFFGLSTTILVLACFNFINISLTQTLHRAKLIGVLKVIGSSKALIKQIFFETIITLMVCFLFASALMEIISGYLRVFFKASLNISLLDNILLYVCLFVILLLLFSVFVLSFVFKMEIAQVIRGDFQSTKTGGFIKNSILVVQYTIASFFIISMFFIALQTTYVQNKDRGYNFENVISAPLILRNNIDMDADRFSLIEQAFLKIKGVEKVSLASIELGGGTGSSVGFSYNGKGLQGFNVVMDFGFLDLLQIPMSQGRQFQNEFASDKVSNILISEKIRELMGEPDPIGKTIDWNDEILTIVGVVKDFNALSLRNDYMPMVFFSLNTVPWISQEAINLYFKIDTSDFSTLVDELEATYNGLQLSEQPFDYTLISPTLGKDYYSSLQEKNLFLILNIVVVIMALSGLFGVCSSTISGQLKQIAIRKVLGADRFQLVLLLGKRYITFCFLGFLLAIIPSKLFVESYLADYHFRIELSFWPFLVCLLIIVSLTIIVSGALCLRATGYKTLHFIKYD
ncbi:ABC transporter permease [Myroides sp. LJL116]